MRSRPELQAADVRDLMAAARAEAASRGLAATVAVVDAAGVLFALERLDGAPLHTPEAATLKARTAAVVRTPAADPQRAAAGDPALLCFPGRLPLAGGIPLVQAGEVVGGVGSSGGEPEGDLRVCQAAVEALAKLRP